MDPTPDLLKQFERWLTDSGKSLGTVHQYVSALSPFFRFLSEHGIPTEPVLPVHEAARYAETREPPSGKRSAAGARGGGLSLGRRITLRSAMNAYLRWQGVAGSPGAPTAPAPLPASLEVGAPAGAPAPDDEFEAV